MGWAPSVGAGPPCVSARPPWEIRVGPFPSRRGSDGIRPCGGMCARGAPREQWMPTPSSSRLEGHGVHPCHACCPGCCPGALASLPCLAARSKRHPGQHASRLGYRCHGKLPATSSSAPHQLNSTRQQGELTTALPGGGAYQTGASTPAPHPRVRHRPSHPFRSPNAFGMNPSRYSFVSIVCP